MAEVRKLRSSLPEVPKTKFADLNKENSIPFNPEAYLLAENRIKYKSKKAKIVDETPNDAKKGRKPSKGKRALTKQKTKSSLPERETNFSIVKEEARVLATGLKVDRTNHATEIAKLLESIEKEFPLWFLLMNEGFSIILHGFGSKRPVMTSFESFLDERKIPHMTLEGLTHNKFNTKQFLIDFVNSLDWEEEEDRVEIKGTNTDAISEDLYNRLPVEHRDFYILVQSFDALALNHPDAVTALCNLTKLRWCHFIVSSDNINVGLGMTQNQAAQLNLYWVHCSTFQPYTEEFKLIPNIFGDVKKNKGNEDTLRYVLKSLTGNARKTFYVLAKLQLEKKQSHFGRQGRSSQFVGVEFNKLALKCREAFIAHSDAALKMLLVEFIDHKLISQHTGKSKSIANMLTIDLEDEILEKMLRDSSYNA